MGLITIQLLLSSLKDSIETSPNDHLVQEGSSLIRAVFPELEIFVHIYYASY